MCTYKRSSPQIYIPTVQLSLVLDLVPIWIEAKRVKSLKHVLEKKMKIEENILGIIESAGSFLDDDGKPKRTGLFLNPNLFHANPLVLN